MEYISISSFNKSTTLKEVDFTQSIANGNILKDMSLYKLNLLKLKIPLDEAPQVYIEPEFPLVLDGVTIHGEFKTVKALLGRVNEILTSKHVLYYIEDGSFKFKTLPDYISVDHSFTMNKYMYSLLDTGNGEMMYVTDNVYRFLSLPKPDGIASEYDNASGMINWSNILVYTDLPIRPMFKSLNSYDLERKKLLTTLTLDKVDTAQAVYNDMNSTRLLDILGSGPLNTMRFEVYVQYENGREIKLKMGTGKHTEIFINFVP